MEWVGLGLSFVAFGVALWACVKVARGLPPR